MRFILLVCLLSGCTINVTDKRISPEQIDARFKQYDENILILAEALNKVSKQEQKKGSK